MVPRHWVQWVFDIPPVSFPQSSLTHSKGTTASADWSTAIGRVITSLAQWSSFSVLSFSMRLPVDLPLPHWELWALLELHSYWLSMQWPEASGPYSMAFGNALVLDIFLQFWLFLQGPTATGQGSIAMGWVTTPFISFGLFLPLTLSSDNISKWRVLHDNGSGECLIPSLWLNRSIQWTMASGNYSTAMGYVSAVLQSELWMSSRGLAQLEVIPLQLVG